MAPRSDFVPKSSLGIVPPATRRYGSALTSDLWLEEKKDTDGAEGLWRVHDGLYDLTNFIDKHPGGEEWLVCTKGTDITEAFEVHHLTSGPEEILKKYFVRKASQRRNSPFTFKEDGFYKSLKRAVSKELKNIPKQAAKKSEFFIDGLLLLLFLFSILAARFWSYWLGAASGILLSMLTGAAHNFFHMRNNFRMYYFHFSLLQVREFRISHVLSHHLYTNTINDLEISLFEPFLEYLPIYKTPLRRYGAALVGTPLICLTLFHGSFIKRCIKSWRCKDKNFSLINLCGFLLPLAMYVFGGQPFLDTFWMWNYVLLVGSTFFLFVGLHAGHHHPDNFHDGDTPRSTTDYDWGVSQLDTIMDRKEINRSHLLALTSFGHHGMHHMFPTLDHGTLEYLYPVLKKVMNDFDLDLRIVSQWDTIIGGFQQLAKIKPNTTPPDMKKYKTK